MTASMGGRREAARASGGGAGEQEGPAWIAVETRAPRRTRRSRRRSARRLLHLGLLGPTASHAVPRVNLRARRAREPARPGHEAVGRSSAEFRARATLWRPPPAVPRGDDQRAMANRAEPGPPFRPLLWKANVSKFSTRTACIQGRPTAASGWVRARAGARRISWRRLGLSRPAYPLFPPLKLPDAAGGRACL